MEPQQELRFGSLDEPDLASGPSSEMPERRVLSVKTDVKRVVSQDRALIVDSPAGWDPYEVWLTRIRPQHPLAEPGAAGAVAATRDRRRIRAFARMLLGMLQQIHMESDKTECRADSIGDE